MLSLWSPIFLAHLDSLPPNHLVLWTDGSVPFGGGGSGVLANFSLWHRGHSFLFSRSSLFKFFRWSLRHSARSLLISAAPEVCHFSCFLLLSDSRSVLTTLSSPLSFLLPQTLWQNFLLFLPVLSAYNGSLDTRFSRGTTRLMSWSDRERYLRPMQSLVVSLLLSLVFTLLFSRTGGVRSHRNSSTCRFPRFSPRVLCSLVMLAMFSLVYAATDTAFCYAPSFQDWQNQESFLQRLRTLISGHLSSHSALFSYGLFAPLCLSTSSGPGPGKLLGFWGSMVFRHASIPRKGSGNDNNTYSNSGCLNYIN